MANNYKKDIFYTDPVKFFEEFLDIKLHWWQKYFYVGILNIIQNLL